MTTTSADLAERAARVIPGGVNSNVRLSAPRIFFEHGRGARLWDVDGNEYVDYLLGQGPAFLGHADERVVAAVTRAVSSGMVYGAQHELEVVAAEHIVEALGWADSVRLGVSGSEAVHGALRLARGATGRRRLLRFAGQYHGWFDTVLMTFDGNTGSPATVGQPADHLADWVVVPFNDLAAVRRAFDAHPGEIAAVILEPMMCNNGAIVPQDGFLQGLRDLCTANGTVLVFDEVITGFRLALGGAAERFGVTPDLAVYGKALAGGWPVAAIAGRGELMDAFGAGTVNHSGTFNGSVMAAAAVTATLEVLRDDPPYERIDAHGTALMAGLSERADAAGVALHVQGIPVAFHVSFGRSGVISDYAGLASLDLDGYAAFAQRLCRHGVWVAGRGIWYVSAAHGSAELSDTLTRFGRALDDHVANR
ncbi:aspartate aminotransferase family protein [Desertimonas flava]|uniref:aspartate aminotransferase family protein n=1 Tax=Desertimonas flava TaxID=2064846 RepID=UPI000E34A3C3|nr:aspartate aminotransferase family protein [Desertimonas flava]